MTTAPPDAVDQVPDQPAEPSIGEQLATLAVVEALQDGVVSYARELRDAAGAAFVRAYRSTDGTKQIAVRIDGMPGDVCNATLTLPHPTAAVTDPAAYRAYVERRFPGSDDIIERTVTIQVKAGFGADALVTDILNFLADYVDAERVIVKEAKTVRPSFQTAHLAKNLNEATLTVEEPDPTTGEMTPVPGVTVTPHEPNGVFQLKGYNKDVKEQVRRAVVRNGLGLDVALGVTPPAALGDARTVPGEVI